MNRMIYDAIPTYDVDGDHWMLHVVDYDWDTGESFLVGPCGGITYEEEDFPTERQQVSMWIRYWGYVIENDGSDPLNQIPSRPTMNTDLIKWHVALKDTENGVRVHAREGRDYEWKSGMELPKYFREFFDLDPHRPSCMRGRIDGGLGTINEIVDIVRDRDVLSAWAYGPPAKLKDADRWGIFVVERRYETHTTPEEIVAQARKNRDAEMRVWKEYTLNERVGVTI